MASCRSSRALEQVFLRCYLMMLLFYMVSLPWLHIILLSKLFMNETYDTGEGTGGRIVLLGL